MCLILNILFILNGGETEERFPEHESGQKAAVQRLDFIPNIFGFYGKICKARNVSVHVKQWSFFSDRPWHGKDCTMRGGWRGITGQ